MCIPTRRRATSTSPILTKPGRAAEEIIAELMPRSIREFPWPKSMRWGKASAKPGSLRWVRPLQSIVCTFGPETEEPVVVDFEIDGIRAGNVTYGHRFQRRPPITVRRFDDYVAKLEKAKVVLDADRRKEIILSDAQNIAFASGLELVEDDGLLEEVSGLVEWPVVLMGEFEEDFLAIPAGSHPLDDQDQPEMFCTSRAISPRGEISQHRCPTGSFSFPTSRRPTAAAEIAYGNGKVVRARLSDALYFWNTDQHDLPDMHTLAAAAIKFDLDLKNRWTSAWRGSMHLNVTFHAKLGTQGERVTRIRALARRHRARGWRRSRAGQCAPLYWPRPTSRPKSSASFRNCRAAWGANMPLLQNEHPSVAAAIEEHYKPQGPSDRVPTDPVSVAVALADKLDTLVGFWAIDEKPTGSKDPFALRRAALGVIRLVLENSIQLDLIHTLIRHGDRFHGHDPILTAFELADFFRDRLKVQLRDSGARHDLVDAVFETGIRKEAFVPGMANVRNLYLIVRRVEALGKFLESEDGRNLLAGTKRAANILAAEEKKGTAVAAAVEPSLFREEAEKKLFAAVNQAEKQAGQAIENEDFSGAMLALSALREPVDSFFEKVLVNDEDVDVRANRLALLSRIRAATGQVADFSKIAG